MKLHPFYFTVAVILIGTFFIIYFIFRNYGERYDQGLASLIQRTRDAPLVKRDRAVKKITLIEDDSCMEITPDGIVRTYDTCAGNLIDANRVADPKFVLRLIQIASQIDFSKYRKKISGPFITLIIETASGTETIYVPTGDEGNDITDTIDLIKKELPQPTSTPGPYTQTPTPTLGGVSNSPTPTPLISNTPGPSPTPNPNPTQIQDNPFICGYTETSGGTKPYNISNFICTTQPSPAPTP